jgi:hypothetical protein
VNANHSPSGLNAAESPTTVIPLAIANPAAIVGVGLTGADAEAGTRGLDEGVAVGSPVVSADCWGSVDVLGSTVGPGVGVTVGDDVADEVAVGRPSGGRSTTTIWSPPAASRPTATARPLLGELMIVRGADIMVTFLGAGSSIGAHSGPPPAGQTSRIVALR